MLSKTPLSLITTLSLILPTLLFASGCVGPSTRPFLHEDRHKFSLLDSELEKLQFYVSQEVLVIQDGDADTASRSILVPRETPGIVTVVGPEWLVVSFAEGSEVPFVADPQNKGNLYHLGSRKDGEDGYEKLTGKTFRQGDAEYQIVYGEKCYLLVDRDGLQQLIDSRKIEGRIAE